MLGQLVFIFETAIMILAIVHHIYRFYECFWTQHHNHLELKPVMVMLLISCTLILVLNILITNPGVFFVNDKLMNNWTTLVYTFPSLPFVSLAAECCLIVCGNFQANIWHTLRVFANVHLGIPKLRLKRPYLLIGLPGYGLPMIIYCWAVHRAYLVEDDQNRYQGSKLLLRITIFNLFICALIYTVAHCWAAIFLYLRNTATRKILYVLSSVIIYVVWTGAIAAVMYYFVGNYDYGERYVVIRAPMFTLFLGVYGAMNPIVMFMYPMMAKPDVTSLKPKKWPGSV
ncbi:unnamed protein product, partial [Mesorhabditis spiculigera]